MQRYLIGVFLTLLFISGCQPNPEKKARAEYDQLEQQWSSMMQRDPSLAISKQWVERFWEFRNRYKGTSAATKATIKVFELSRKIVDLAGIETKYKQLSLNDDALAELLDIIRIAAPSDDESFEWRRIVENTSNERVRIPGLFRLASYYFQFNQYEKCMPLLDTLSSRYSITEADLKYGSKISSMKQTMAALSVGNVLPAFQLSDIRGNAINSKELKGKVVLLYFYGSTCGPCMKMYPTLNHLFSKYQSDKFFLLGIAADKQAGLEKKFPGFLKKFNISWPQTLDVRLFYRYNIGALSTSLILDKRGRLVFMGHSDKVISSMDFLQGKSLEDAVVFLIDS